MHLLAATPGSHDDGQDPVDLQQTPGDLLVLSAADSELAALSQARGTLDRPPVLRLANLGHLRHPMSVDLHVDACAARSRLVVARLLGGRGYWRYGVDQLSARLHEAGVPLALLPGDDAPDAELRALSTVSDADYDSLWAYMVEGGIENAANFLRHARHMLADDAAPPAARPLLRAGTYWPGSPGATLDTIRANWPEAAPVVPIVFYRALVQGAGLAPVDRLTRALLRQGMAPLPIFVASLKDPVSAATLDRLFDAAPPSVIVNATAFATGTPHDGPNAQNPLSAASANGAPVLQAILAGMTEAAWSEGTAGLTGRDIAMNVALPEVDGRIATRAIGFKDEAFFDAETECPVVTWRAQGDRVDFVARLARNWARLRAEPVATRRVALILANYPNRDGRLANGVGLDTPASTVAALNALAAAGYDVRNPPADSAALMEAIQAGPTNWLPDRALRTGGVSLPLATYRRHFDALPWEVRDRINARWGPPERDPFLQTEHTPEGTAAAEAVGTPEANAGPSFVAGGWTESPPESEPGPVPNTGSDTAQGTAPGTASDTRAEAEPNSRPASAPDSAANSGSKTAPASAPTSGSRRDAASGAAFKLSILTHGRVVIGLQPARGYNIDPTETYHSPDLVPPHHYLAFYIWLREEFGAQAIVHMGKHGNLEWLPGKALALSGTCLPEAVLGPMPHVYPFIVNDPGEGTQAKRRAQAVIIAHLTPPLTRAESYGPMRDLEALVDEYYEAAGVDPRRITHLRREILSLTAATGLDRDAGLAGDESDDDLAKLDAFLCELKEAQIRDGLHIFGATPEGRQKRDLLIALTRIPRGDGRGGDASLPRALAADLALGADPLDCDMAAAWTGPRPEILADTDPGTWRSHGDTVERLELLAQALIAGEVAAPGPATAAVLSRIDTTIRPALDACGPGEMSGLLTALSGHFVAPAPSGAPTRGRLDTLPTGRNFYSVDSRAVPTPTAWALGRKSAELLIETHLQREGDWPRALLLTAWGTANMRTGGDDIAQALALMGVRPTWDAANRRVTGFEILPLATLGRPRVDVTLRISGFFRDAFPQLVALVDRAARAVQALDEPADQNPAAARARTGEAAPRVYGSKPGAYGAGLQAMIDERLWSDRADLADAYLAWGSWAYSADSEGVADRAGLETRLSQADAIVQNQDNREHDVLDSDDYYQFEGGAASAVATLQGRDRPIYHNDHSRPERPVIRTLDEEISRVVRSRVVNPKWIAGVKRHGYKGAFEIAATVDYLFAFAASTRSVQNHHFDLVEEAVLGDDDTRAFIAEANPAALAEIAQRLQEAIDRDLWLPRSNSARARIAALL